MPRLISPRFIAFLRAINVGGHIVKMTQLKTAFEALGLKDVETFIASGNVIFTTRATDTAALEKTIETRLRKTLGYDVATFLRTDAEVAAVAGYPAFKAAQITGAKAFCVGFTGKPLDAAAKKALMRFKSADEDFHTNGREVYWLSMVGQGHSTFNNASLEKALQIRSTFRSLTTVVRLAAKYKPL